MIVPCVTNSPSCTNGSFGFNTGTGYDLVTGLGSVDVYNLIHQWSSQPPLTSAVVPSIDQTPFLNWPGFVRQCLAIHRYPDRRGGRGDYADRLHH